MGSGPMCVGIHIDAYKMPKGSFEVMVPRATTDIQKCYRFITDNYFDDWSYDWMHGEERSAPTEEKKQYRFLFENKDDAAKFKLVFG